MPAESLRVVCFDAVCHRLPARCLADADQVGAVLCARCAGLYLGAVLAGLAWLSVRRVLLLPGYWPLVLAGLLVLPTPVEVVGERLGWWAGDPAVRYLLALGCGVGLVMGMAQFWAPRQRVEPAGGRLVRIRGWVEAGGLVCAVLAVLLVALPDGHVIWGWVALIHLVGIVGLLGCAIWTVIRCCPRSQP